MKNLYKSLAAFQQECPIIHKGTKGYGYSYADLPTILEIINPLLKKHGLGFYQAVKGFELLTVVFHIESGEQVQNGASIPQNVDLKGMNQFQVLGSAITYMRRYQLSAMLGIVTDKDTDAATPQSEQQKQQKQEPAQGQSDLQWLNPNTEKWNAAKDWIAKGNAIEGIRKYYKISNENFELLKSETA